jgi:hypothetical protein
MNPSSNPGARGLAAALLMAAIAARSPAGAGEDAFVCMEETQDKCDHENRNMALFIEGRDAFDRG